MSSRLEKEDSRDRLELIETVNKLLSLNKDAIQPNKVSTQIDDWSLQGIISPQKENQWYHNDCCKTLNAKMCIVSDDLIESLHPFKMKTIEKEQNNCSHQVPFCVLVHDTLWLNRALKITRTS